MKVLITCGPTWVPIDNVRVISNVSSGEMGHLIAESFKKAGASVTILQGPVTHHADLKNIRVIKYMFFDELARLLKQECGKKYDIIVHAAAVSDYKLAKAVKGKIVSSKKLNLTLTATPKLINLIKKWAPQSFIVGFKLESGISVSQLKARAEKLFVEAGCDVVIANQLTPKYAGYILNADGDVLFQSHQKKDIATQLVRNVS